MAAILGREQNLWQQYWEENKTFKTEMDSSRPKSYVLEMFPYPSGNLHMGHVRNYSIGDVVARFRTMNGFNVLHPMGWDSFGMPAENAAIKHGIPPKKWTMENIANMTRASPIIINGPSGSLNFSINAAWP